MDEEPKLRRSNIRLALWLAAVAMAVLVAFVWSVAGSEGGHL